MPEDSPSSHSETGQGNRQARVLELLFEALELEQVERQRFLAVACGQDDELRAEVEALIQEEDEVDDGFLEEPPVAAKAPELVDERTLEMSKSLVAKISRQAAASALPEQLGPYRVVEPLGEGGMGKVYLAEQAEPVLRRVAIKVIDAIDRPERRKRFAAEGQALARLAHPNVATLFEVAATADGRPYVVMEHVEGKPITDWCDQHRLGLRERIKLFFGVCDGVAHAHEKGLLHRDLKPANVLVANFDGRPIAKVIDFGIASTLDEPLLAGTRLTQERELLGSPAYMSPEAVLLGAHALDTRSDVYGLGLLLFELLVGARPHGDEDITLARLFKRLAEEEIPSASRRYASLDTLGRRQAAHQRRLSSSALRRRLSGDLEAILGKATARERDDRYSSPADLVVELGRYLDHQPVEARTPTALYTTKRFLRRHLGSVAAVGLLILILAGGLAARTFEAHKTAEALAESEAMSGFLIDLLAQLSDPRQRQGEAVHPGEILERSLKEVRVRLASQSRAKAHLMDVIGNIYVRMGRYEQARTLLAEALVLNRELFPADHPRLGSALSSVAQAYRRLGRYDEAEPAYRQAIEILEQAPGASRELARALGGLARTYLDLESYKAAQLYARREIEILERVLEPDDPLLATPLDRLGSVYLKQGKLDLAESLRKRALSIREAAFGPDHSDVADSLNNLGNLYRQQNRIDKAEASFRRALEIKERVVGPEHPHIASILSNLANILVEKGQAGEAQPLVRRALMIRRETLEPGHPQIASSLAILSNILLQMGHLQEAETAVYEAATIRERVLGPDHPRTADAFLGLAVVLNAQGRLREAEPFYLRVIEIYTAAGNPKADEVRAEYAARLRAQGRDEEAEALMISHKSP